VLRRLRADAAMCSFGIDELRQHPDEVLLFGRHAEEHALGAQVPVETLHVGNGKPQFDLSRWILVGSRVQRQSGLARRELASTRRLELHPSTEHITVELHRLAHVGDELDHVSHLCSLHLTPPVNAQVLVL
jgi:hypothetical protein